MQTTTCRAEGSDPVEGERQRAIIFLAGMGTHLAEHEAFNVPGGCIADFWGEERLVARIDEAGLSATHVVFSYRGVRSDGEFEPAPYDPSDTMCQGLAAYVAHLNRLIVAYARDHPGTEIHLIGHSGGGLIAFAYVAQLAFRSDWTLPNDSRLASVVTLDAPLGGVRTGTRLQLSAVRAYFLLMRRRQAVRNIIELQRLYETSENRYPLGANARVAALIERDGRVVDAPTNQEVARIARASGVRLLTIGNGRDHCFAPGIGLSPFLSTQWLRDEGSSSGIYGRWTVLGEQQSSVTTIELNHGAILSDATVHQAIVKFLQGGDPNPLPPAPRAESLRRWLSLEHH